MALERPGVRAGPRKARAWPLSQFRLEAAKFVFRNSTSVQFEMQKFIDRFGAE
jgi:hypothetical protein